MAVFYTYNEFYILLIKAFNLIELTTYILKKHGHLLI